MREGRKKEASMIHVLMRDERKKQAIYMFQ